MVKLCPRLFPAFALFVVCENRKTKEPKKLHESPKSSTVAEVIVDAESSAESSSSSEEDGSDSEIDDSLSTSRVWFPQWLFIFSDSYVMNPEGSGSDAALYIICKKYVYQKTNVVHCDIVVSLARGDNHQQVTTKAGACRKQ